MKIGKNSVLVGHLPFSKPKDAEGRTVEAATFGDRAARGGWLPLRAKPADRHVPRQGPPHIEFLWDTNVMGAVPSLMCQRDCGPDLDVHEVAARLRAQPNEVQQPDASSNEGDVWTSAARLQVRLPRLTLQHGHTCKPTALAMLDHFHATRLKVPNIPMRKNQGGHYESQLNRFAVPQAPLRSVRQIAKAHGSVQGEVLESSAMERMAKDMGYRTQTKSPSDVDDFGSFVVKQLKQGNPPLAFFAVSKGAPGDAPWGFPSLDHPEQEHACLIVGIDPKQGTIDIAHWGEVYRRVPIERFHRSMKTLAKTRSPETYVRTDPAGSAPTDPTPPDHIKYQLVKQDASEHQANRDALRTTATPALNTGFQNLLLSITPDDSNARWGTYIPDQQREDQAEGSASGASKIVGLSDLGGNLSLAGTQHNFFIELADKPAGHAMERPSFGATARFDRTEPKRRTANKIWRSKGVVPNGWNLQGMHPDKNGPTTVIAKRLYSSIERLQLPGTTGSDWVLNARRSKLYQASPQHETSSGIPAAVRQAKALVRKADESGEARISSEPIGDHCGIHELRDVLTFELPGEKVKLPGEKFKLTMPAPEPGSPGVPIQDADRTLVISAHGKALKDEGTSTTSIPDDLTIGMFGPPGRVLIGDVVPCIEERGLYAAMRQGNGQLEVDLIAPDAKAATRFSQISGTEESGKVANLLLQKSGRVSETIVPTRNESGQKDGQTSGPVAYRDSETLREFAFMSQRDKAHVLTIGKDSKIKLPEVFDLVAALKAQGLTYKNVLPYACRTDRNDDSAAYNSNNNLAGGSSTHDRRKVDENGALVPVASPATSDECLDSAS